MKAKTLGVVIVPLAIAALALLARELSRETPSSPTPGRGTPLVPRAVVALIERRLPTSVELAVDPSASAARIVTATPASTAAVSGVAEREFTVEGRLTFDAEGGLAHFELSLAPRTQDGAAAEEPTLRLLATSVRARATSADALRAATVSIELERGTERDPLELDVRWTALPDGGVAVQGEGRAERATFGLPDADGVSMLHGPPAAILAFELLLARRD